LGLKKLKSTQNYDSSAIQQRLPNSVVASDHIRQQPPLISVLNDTFMSSCFLLFVMPVYFFCSPQTKQLQWIRPTATWKMAFSHSM